MATEYTKYLAGAILTENQIVTYRLLSRVLKVHHNEAKRMLYEFHRQQNARKPGLIHATYLVTGIQVLEKSVEASQSGQTDSLAPSSPYMSSFTAPAGVDEVVPVRQRVLTLVKEESLDSAKARYESISSIHVYSLEPNTLKNLEMLSAVTQKIMTEYISEDPLIHNKTYGVIQNGSVKRRAGSRPLPKPLPVKEETKSVFAKTKDPKTSEPTKTLSKPKEAPPGSGEQATKVGAPALIKRESSDLFQAFAKAKPKAKGTTSTPSRVNEDTTMKDASDNASDEDMDISAEADAAFAARRAKRLADKEKRRKLLEDDDEDDNESMQGIKQSNPPSDTEANTKAQPESSRDASPDHDSEAQEDEPPSAPIDAPAQKQEEPEEQPPVTVSGGRRRGRRKVTKKKVTRDADGNIETQEVVDWESFSEDEVPAPTLIKAKPASGGTAKAKKAAGKPGQGNIMAFFGKK